ncbi:MAG: chemotaxis protein CheW [Bdellovibrionales bacterium]
MLSKAIEKGIVKEGANLTEGQIQELILQPGFSTAEKLTDVSGRGVGMDVVKRAVIDLGGEVNISSKLGNGTTFSTTLPTSLNIIDSLIVRVGATEYAIPVTDLKEVVNLDDFKIETSTESAKMFNFRNQVVPIENLAKYLATNGSVTINEDEGRYSTPPGSLALIVEQQNKKIAFEVDKIVTQQPVVVRNFSSKVSQMKGIGGGTILGNGEPGLIINLKAIAESVNLQRNSEAS